MRRSSARAFLLLAAAILGTGWRNDDDDARRRKEAADVEALTALTRIDHSTLFLNGPHSYDYIRDGVFHQVQLRDVRGLCHGRAVSRDGTRLAYVILDEAAKGCLLLIRDLATGRERSLVRVDQSYHPFAWSWDDESITCDSNAGLVVISVRDGRRRVAIARPFHINGQLSPPLETVDWVDALHDRDEMMVDGYRCLPDDRVGCRALEHVLVMSASDSRVLARGAGGSVSPLANHIAYGTDDHIEIVDADGTNRRRVADVPRFFGLPVFRPFVTIVMWSPRADRLLFGTLPNNDSSTGDYYLVDLAAGTRRRILNRTRLSIVAWRPSGGGPPR